MKSNMSTVKFDTGDVQRELICILSSNVTIQGSRFIIQKNEWTINSASKLFNSLPTTWKCKFVFNSLPTTWKCKLSDEKVLKKSVEPLSPVYKETTTDDHAPAFAVTAPNLCAYQVTNHNKTSRMSKSCRQS